MSRYFFSVRVDGTLIPDEDGLELASLDELEGEAELEQLAVIGVGYADLHETWPNTLCQRVRSCFS
jgi:hypothetical protein